MSDDWRGGWAFAFSRRWAGYLALAVLFAVICSLLGVWQFARRAEALAQIARIDANYDAAPQPLDDVLRSPRAFDDDQEWTQVEITGTYLVGDQLLARNRPYNGQPGFEVLAPLQRADGSVFVVDRGWIPAGNTQDAPDSVPAPPDGEVTVVARLKPGEPTVGGRSAPAGQIATIHLPTIADELGRATYTGAYGLLVSEDPATAVLPAPAVKPIRDEGPHLSYALQWFVFAIIGFAGLGWALRQEYRAVNAEDPEERERAAARARRARERAPSDAEIEDAIVDGRR